MEPTPEIKTRLSQLEEKYKSMGQDMVSYLDGLLYSDYLTYWDYIHIDTLLTLQNTRTKYPDETVFIIYHQITELYFKLILWEIQQITNQQHKPDFLTTRMHRINRYWENLIRSFDIMVDGMDKEEFMKFRMALLPASGFQSAQYRLIEICATDFINLVSPGARNNLKNSESFEEMYEHIYWKTGSVELQTGKKTLTLRQFEEKYSTQFIKTAYEFKEKNLNNYFQQTASIYGKDENLQKEYKQFDLNVNVHWPLVHYRSAVRYLQNDPDVIAATGGTNWQKYLPPRFQRRIFFPDLWSKEEMDEWGRGATS
ncbi:MAG: tryptophan 2,3-dioxygenase [Bacteroidetes bacterium RIFCSPLOWO2_02_FULL_36_8]|nr:MAG: tryptophan 2,3-dioxygenase [Bacteroidetes bacterium RIFCSPLOWO2_02_FULL_36_8]OFY69884.1 MAG: tryptophan 2,3-dioxygenase [Bacteroidetes bacterium RIFCSPLOWO2_12_FULL_37_12]